MDFIQYKDKYVKQLSCPNRYDVFFWHFNIYCIHTIIYQFWHWDKISATQFCSSEIQFSYDFHLALFFILPKKGEI